MHHPELAAGLDGSRTSSPGSGYSPTQDSTRVVASRPVWPHLRIRSLAINCLIWGFFLLLLLPQRAIRFLQPLEKANDPERDTL